MVDAGGKGVSFGFWQRYRSFLGNPKNQIKLTLKLFIIRHGKAEPLAPTDLERALAPRGIAQSRELAQRLPPPSATSLALISPARRTLQTSENLLAGWGLDAWPQAEVVPWGHLAPAEAWHRACGEAPPEIDTIYVIGHNPGLSEWAEAMLGESGGGVFLATAEAIEIQFDLPDWRYLARGVGSMGAWFGRSPR